MESTKEKQLFHQIVDKAWKDENFKNELIQNPVETIENFTGEKLNLPKGKKFVVSDQSNTSVLHINIPAKPSLDDLQLNEEQLEAVAGGADLVDIIKDVIDIITRPIPTIPTTPIL